MIRRWWFWALFLFWVTMNALLWRAEFGGGKEVGSEIPIELVWQKMLTAPDTSTLEASQQKKRIGFCRWSPNIREAQPMMDKTNSESLPPEGMVSRVTGYTIDLEGNLLVDTTNRLRFELHIAFSANHVWQEVRLKMMRRSGNWEILAKSASQSVQLRYGGEDDLDWDRTFTYDKLRNPGSLLQELGVPWVPGLLGTGQAEQTKMISLGLKWSARNDWLKVGHARVRVYRLQARLFDRYQAVVLVSRVGEILRVELPNDLLLLNESLSVFTN